MKLNNEQRSNAFIEMLIVDLRDAAKTFRYYEAAHLSKHTAEGDVKAHSNGALAKRFEDTLAAVDQEMCGRKQ